MSGFNQSKRLRLSDTKMYKYEEKVPVWLGSVPPTRNIASKVLGQNGINLQYIIHETGADVALRGLGSDHGSIQEPLHILIKHDHKENLQAAQKLAVGLVETILQELNLQPVQPCQPILPHRGGSQVNILASSPLPQISLPETSFQNEHLQYMQTKEKEQTQSQPRSNMLGNQSLNPESESTHGSTQQPSMNEILEQLRKNINEKSRTMNHQPLATLDARHLTLDTGVSKLSQNQQFQQVLPPSPPTLHNVLASPFLHAQQNRTYSSLKTMQQTPTLSQFTQQITQIFENLHQTPTENKNNFQSSPKDHTKVSCQSLPPLQFLPQQKPEVSEWTYDVEINRGETNLCDKTPTHGEVSHPCGGPSIAILKQERFLYGNDPIILTLVPENGESLYSACAHLLFGPFHSVSELTATARTLHRRVVHFIKKNRDNFFLDLKKLYDETFPNHGLDDSMVFDHCCLYLAKPGHVGVRQTMLAIASLFSKPIIILYETGGNPCRIDPLGSTIYEDSPITLFSRMNVKNHFDSIDRFLNEDLVSQLYTPTIKRKLFVATWEVDSFSTIAERNTIDQILVSKDIDFVCLQGNNTCGAYESSTANYTWWYAVHKSIQSVGCLAFLLNKKCAASLQNFCPISGNLASAVICLKYFKLTVIGCYLPEFENQFRNVSTITINENYDKISSDIEKLLQETSSNSILLLGQFNACIGSSDLEPREKPFIGSNLLHEKCNRNGLFLKQLAVKYSLNIISLSSLQPQPSKPTYMRGKYLQDRSKLQISHILLRANHNNCGLLRNNKWLNRPFSFHSIVASLIQF